MGEMDTLCLIDGENGSLRKEGVCIEYSNLTDDDFVCIDVSGNRFYTLKFTLERYSQTLLGNRYRRYQYYVKCKNALFFDRNIDAFTAILYYYQSGGILIRPPDIPMEQFAEEIEFFELGDDVILSLREKEGFIHNEPEKPEELWKRVIWDLFEFPDTSIWARILSFVSIFVIIISIILFCVETLPTFQHHHHDVADQKCNRTNNTNQTKEAPEPPWFTLEMSCIVWFTFEYIMRFISSPNKCMFLKSFLNTIDFLAILPYFITMTIKSGKSTPLSVLRIVRLVRVFRIFKLSRYNMGMRILIHTLRASIKELGMLVCFLMIGVVLFSSAVFYAEEGNPGTAFISIPHTFWYTLVTMTTVGYGDMSPETLWGKLIGSLCALTGVLTIALPVPVIASNFLLFYKRDSKDSNKKQP